MTALTQELLRELLVYDSITGEFIWKRRDRRHFPSDRAYGAWNSNFAGVTAGGINPKGYRTISVFNRRYRAHRLAFLYMTGYFPVETDHIHGVRDDNRWSEIRDVTRAENQKNLSLPTTNTSGQIGISWSKDRGRWEAYIHVNGKRKSLGRFIDFDDACTARKEAEAAYGYHPGHGKTPANVLLLRKG